MRGADRLCWWRRSSACACCRSPCLQAKPAHCERQLQRGITREFAPGLPARWFPDLRLGAGPGERVVLHLVTDLQQSASPTALRGTAATAQRNARPRGRGYGVPASNLRVAQVALAERNATEAVVRVEGDAPPRRVARWYRGQRRGARASQLARRTRCRRCSDSMWVTWVRASTACRAPGACRFTAPG